MRVRKAAAHHPALLRCDLCDEDCGMMAKANFARRLTLCLTGAAVIACCSMAAMAQGTPAVPVTVTTVTKQDVPLWLRGLGTVQAYYSVQMRPRVDGTLTQVPVTEGQDVKKGDLLAVIDPRPYQAT